MRGGGWAGSVRLSCSSRVKGIPCRGIFRWAVSDRLLMSDVLFESVLVCPVCGFAKRETMPTDACQFFYECVNCKTLLRPKSGDCCVFCSYGSVKCPPMQGEKA
jgi:hypothetical protein